MQTFALAFTGVASLGLFGGFGLELWRFRKYRNWQHLNTDLVLLFLLAGLFLTASGVVSMWDTASDSQQYGRKGIWIAFSIFMCSVCSWLLSGWFKNRKRKSVTKSEPDKSIIHSSSIPLSDDEESVDNDLKGSDDDNEFSVIESELLDDSENTKEEGSDEDKAKEVFIDESEEVTPDIQVDAQ